MPRKALVPARAALRFAQEASGECVASPSIRRWDAAVVNQVATAQARSVGPPMGALLDLSTNSVSAITQGAKGIAITSEAWIAITPARAISSEPSNGLTLWGDGDAKCWRELSRPSTTALGEAA